MTTFPTLKGGMTSRRLIDVPADYERKDSLVEDDALRRSIQANGIQQPLVIISKGGGRFELIDGYRRLQLAAELGLDEVPAVIDRLPDNAVDPEIYRDRIRFVLDQHRQDLFPTQRAELITKLKGMFQLKNKEVALWLGVDAGSITNWLAITKYAPEIREKIDRGEITMHAARALDGMTEDAQLRVYKKHRSDFQKLAGGKLHRLIRETYPPEDNPDFYANPETTARKLKIKTAGRKSAKRKPLTSDEKRSLSRSLALQETELRDGQEDLVRFKREINAATPVIRAILRDKELVAMLTEDQKEEFERFAEVYV